MQLHCQNQTEKTTSIDSQEIKFKSCTLKVHTELVP